MASQQFLCPQRRSFIARPHAQMAFILSGRSQKRENPGFATHREFAPVSLASLVFHFEAVSKNCSSALIFASNKTKDIVNHDSFKYLVAGALAGIVSRTVVSPFEVLATMNMCTTGATRGFVVELKNLFITEGFRGLFKGNAANCLKVAPTKGIQFLTFEGTKRLLLKLRENRKNLTREQKDGPLSAGERLVAGGFAGIVAATVCYPLEVAKTLLTAHPETYKGVWKTVGTVARQRGIRGVYRGLGPTLVAMFPYVGLEFMVYEQLKLRYMKTRKSQDENPSMLSLMLIGAIAGSVAQTSCHPLDVIRKRLQLQGLAGRPVVYKTMVDAGLGIYKNEGFKALYRGLKPTYMSVLPAAAVSYLVYEQCKKLLRVKSV